MYCRFALCFSFLAALATPLPAQSPQTEPRFALEMVSAEGNPPSYALVARGPDTKQSSTFFTSALVPLPSDHPAPSSANAPCALGLEYKQEGDLVSVVVSLYFGTLTGFSDDLTRHPAKQIGTYTLHLGESVTLQEMKTFDLQPYTLTLVTAEIPRSNTPATSKVPGLQLTIVGEDRTSFKLMVRNFSSQTVMGLLIARSAENSRSTLAAYDDREPVVLPGATRYFPMHSQEVTCSSKENPTADVAPCPIVLEAAVFADGSHAGVPSLAARLEASQLATSGPHHQLQELMRSIVDDPSRPDAEKLALLRSGIPKLPTEADPAALERLRSKYPELSDEEWASVKKSVDGAVQREHQRTLDSLAKFEQSSQDPSNTETLAQWMHRWGMF